jgi:hypothetical protein
MLKAENSTGRPASASYNRVSWLETATGEAEVLVPPGTPRSLGDFIVWQYV